LILSLLPYTDGEWPYVPTGKGTIFFGCIRNVAHSPELNYSEGNTSWADVVLLAVIWTAVGETDTRIMINGYD
jgi:hypothetical protein